jgi:hypothetical protein
MISQAAARILAISFDTKGWFAAWFRNEITPKSVPYSSPTRRKH